MMGILLRPNSTGAIFLPSLSLASVSAEKAIFGLCILVVASALFLGGGTASGFLSDALLQILALPLVIVSLWRIADLPMSKQAKWTLVFCLAVVMVPLLQLVPLPPSIWTALPNREPVVEVFDLLGRELSWMPITVSPRATWLSANSLLVPLAVFLGVLLMDQQRRRLLSLAILAVGLVSVFVGLAQLSQGPSSTWRFFADTNPDDATGFFANRNHFAALLYTLSLLAAAWVLDASFAAGRSRNRNRYDTRAVVRLIAGFTVLVVLVAAQAMARSRAGLGLTIIALFGAFAIAIVDRRSTSGRGPMKLLVGAIGLALIFAAQFALYRIMERFTLDPMADARITFAQNTIDAAKAFMPFGSGMGTFVPVYAMFERPEDVLSNRYANRAHNDVLELWLEAGVVGLALMAVFAVWLILRSVEVWRRSPEEVRDIDYGLTRAATLVVGLLIIHSFFDYPLRTGAMMALMAYACALLIEPLVGSQREFRTDQQGGGNVSEHERPRWPALNLDPRTPVQRSPQPSIIPDVTDPPARPSVKKWGEGIEWPEEWHNPSEKPGPDTDDT